jgi:hypothetical protein
MHQNQPGAGDGSSRRQPTGEGGGVDECAALRQQLSEQRSRIKWLEAALAAKTTEEAETTQQLSVARALLLLRNIEAAQNHHSAPARDSSGTSSSTRSSSSGGGCSSTTTTSAVVGAALAAASLEAIAAPQSFSEAHIGQLRRVKLLKHSWRLLREDAQRLQRGIPKIGKWVSAALDEALTLHAARHAELHRKLQQLVDLFES